MKITVALLFGGKSTEHEVSIITALQAYNAFDKDKYDVIPVYITKKQEFYTGDSIGKISEYSDVPALLKKSARVIFMNENNAVKLYEYKSGKFAKKATARIDLAFLAVHGTNVEDGALQGFFQTLGLPYTGCNVLSSAIGMDKGAMKAVLKQAGIPVLDCVIIGAQQYAKGNIPEITDFPVIVKPVNLGSSIGIKIASNSEELTEAIEHALLFSNTCLIERAVTELKEINCSVLGDAGLDEAEASECEEPVSSGEILDFDDKYTSNGGKSKGMASLKRKIPADITAERREEIRRLAINAFKALGCSGVARIDFLLDLGSGEIYFNEINTIPGSLSFYLWEPVGVKYPALLDRICSLTLRRETASQNLNFTFESNILSGFKGGFKGGAK